MQCRTGEFLLRVVMFKMRNGEIRTNIEIMGENEERKKIHTHSLYE